MSKVELHIERTTPENQNFVDLIAILNQEQAKRNGDKNDFYMQFNSTDSLHFALLAKLDDEWIACGALRKFGDQTLEIKRMFTKQAYRQQGIAGQMLQALEEWTAEMGYRKCVLETGMMNPEAIEFYKKHNYKQIPNFGQYANDDDSLCFEKEIK